MADLEHEEIIIKDETKSKYDEPWIVEYIVEERNKDKTWDSITQGLQARGLESISPGQVSTIWKRAVAKTLTRSTEAKEDFINFTADLKAIYGDVIILMGNYVKALRKINEELENIKVVDEEGNVNKLQTQMAIAKQIPLATGLMKEVREYVKNQIALYDVIEQTKEKELNLSSSDVMKQIGTYLPIYLKEQEKLGTIKVIDRSILK